MSQDNLNYILIFLEEKTSYPYLFIILNHMLIIIKYFHIYGLCAIVLPLRFQHE
jgi:hypothetical protein